MSYKLLIFDFDGTLADTKSAIIASTIATFHNFDIKAPAVEEIKNTIGLTLENSFAVLLGRGIRGVKIKEWVDMYRKIYSENETKYVQLFPGVAEFLEFTHVAGIKIVVVSNKKEDAITKTLNRLGVISYIDFIVGDHIGIDKKPAPDIFTKLIIPTFSDINRECMLMIGDTEIDLQFAINAQLASCWVEYGYGKKAKCILLKPTYSINKISELYQIVGKQ